VGLRELLEDMSQSLLFRLEFFATSRRDLAPMQLHSLFAERVLHDANK
jgi:hypothetical protein